MSKNYQTLKQELDDIIVKIQIENLDVDEAIKLYESGNKLISELKSYLENAEQKISKVRSQKG